jgi:hypothetical protein
MEDVASALKNPINPYGWQLFITPVSTLELIVPD